MPTPSIQTLVTDAQQVLNLDSISAVRSVVAVALANANTGTPLNPNLTTQQLWNEFYQVVTKPKSDIESIIANQLMKFLFAPPAPGGVGANKQVIFNDGGVLAGDAGLTYDKATDKLSIVGGLGVGASPSPWQTGLKAINFSTNGVLYANGGNSAFFGNNYYNDAAGTNRYLTNNVATAYGQVSGAHLWYSAPIGNAGDPLTGANAFVQTMALDASGNLAANGYVRAGGRTQIGAGYIGDIFGTGNNMGVFFGSNALLPADGGGNANNNTQNLGATNFRWDKVYVGTGINFPATQIASADANTLDDYEEGTFTPTVIGSSTAGTANYPTQIGRYVKIGRQVTAWIHLEWSGGTGTGNLRFGGLPFTIITLASNNYPSAAIGYISNIALSANNIAIAYGQNAEAAVNLGQYPIGGGSGSSVAYDAAGQIIFTITYEV